MFPEDNDVQLDILRQAVPGLLGQLDDAALEIIRPHVAWEWVELAGGEVLFREGEPTDSICVVVSGRFQASIMGEDGQSRVVGEIGRGESVGEMGALTLEPRRATVVALRDSLLARIELGTFQKMVEACPALSLTIGRVVIERLQKRNASQKPTHNVVNLCVLPISPGLKSGPLLADLQAELEAQNQPALHLTSELIDQAAGRSGAAQVTEADQEGHRWLLRYLDEMEDKYSLVLYQADATLTPWTLRCLRQSDEVLLLGDAAAPPDLSEVEQINLNGEHPLTSARQTLVLLHPADAIWASGTPRFLALRPKVYRHFHLRSGRKDHLARLARFLSGRAVGLVLAGGGARGLAHLGVFRALQEAGVPIDAFGGTSIGSVLGASMAADWSWEKVYDENQREFAANPTSDFSFVPLLSILTGRKLDRILEKKTSGMCIEELWLPFFCVSSSYTQAREVVHTRGDLKRALLASMAIPGVFPPVVYEGDLLMDGGVFNNLPVDLMARSGVGTVMAVELRSLGKEPQVKFDQLPSSWALLIDRLKPRARRRYDVPSLVAMLMAASTLNSQQKTAQVIGDVDVLFQPDVAGFGMLEWKSFEKIVDRGYQHARAKIAQGGLAGLT
ncbi:MAG: cyclic nucleotide-binding and patatin-like phospholipase domain-containing protein [Chthoniobacterales bacterium]